MNLIWLISATVLLILGLIVGVGWHLGSRHRRQDGEEDALMGIRTLHQPGLPDRYGDRTAQLLNEIQPPGEPKNPDTS